MGLGRGKGADRAEECTRRANNSSGIILTAPSSGFGGVAGSRMRSGQSWSCSHNLLLFRTSFFPQINMSSCGAVPAPIMGYPAAGPRVVMSPHGSELSVPLPRVRLKQLPTESCWNGRGIHPPLLLSRGFTLTRSAPGRPVIIYFQHLQQSVRTWQCRIQ